MTCVSVNCVILFPVSYASSLVPCAAVICGFNFTIEQGIVCGHEVTWRHVVAPLPSKIPPLTSEMLQLLISKQLLVSEMLWLLISKQLLASETLRPRPPLVSKLSPQLHLKQTLLKHILSVNR